MNILLITFQVDSLEKQNQMIDSIKRQGNWARISATTWCVKSSNHNATALRDELSGILTDTERLLVVDITNSYWGSYCIPKEVTDWLKS